MISGGVAAEERVSGLRVVSVVSGFPQDSTMRRRMNSREKPTTELE